MLRVRFSRVWIAIGIIMILSSTSIAGKSPVRPFEPPPYQPIPTLSRGPAVLRYGGDTVWVKCHIDESVCPGDPVATRGGEATGGPTGSETWCFEGLDSCGTMTPWDALCWDHVDVRSMPSPMGINYWHVDTYHCEDEAYLDDYCLWCGSMPEWIDGMPVECGTWETAPGYGNEWNCTALLELDHNFDIRHGCDLYFDVRYDTECKYDYLYVEFWDGSYWQTLATFNGSSNNPGPECGVHTGGSPDYWENTDAGQPYTADWQGRAYPDEPAFRAFISYLSFVIEEAPKFRWRFVSDIGWSDADGIGDTDGAAFIDNVIVDGDHGSSYEEDFEGGPGSLGPEWSFPDADPVRQNWHMVEDPDPPYEGGDGGERTSCPLNSSVVWRARPEQGFQQGDPTRNGWYYRLISPPVPIADRGCVVQYDTYMCALDLTCDYTDLKVRFHDSTEDRWCPWINIDGFIRYGGCYEWAINDNEEVTWLYDDNADQVQFAWDIMDVSSPGEFCRGLHARTDYLIDNVSVGFFDGTVTAFETRLADLLHDTFHGSICAHNSRFNEFSSHDLSRYAGPPYDVEPLPPEHQFMIDVRDKDGIQTITLHGSSDQGASWISLPMNLAWPYSVENPALGGTYVGTFCPTDFGLDLWDAGTTVWYYVTCEDGLDNMEYYPAEANPGHPDHSGSQTDYLDFSIFPLFDPGIDKTRTLLVDGYQREVYDWDPCLGDLKQRKPLREIYETTLTAAGYSFDRFDIYGAGRSTQIQPLDYAGYDAVIWFTGPDLSEYLIHEEAWKAIYEYLLGGGKVILAGDKLAQYAEDLEYWRFLRWPTYHRFTYPLHPRYAKILGFEFRDWMPSGFDCPYVYIKGTSEGLPGRTGLRIIMKDALLYRGCPHERDMSWITVDPALQSRIPWGGRPRRCEACIYAQPLLEVVDKTACGEPDGAVAATYVEIGMEGSLVFFNFDLSALINHTEHLCDGDAPDPAPDYLPGNYHGRVEIMGVVLKHLFGLPPD